MTKGLRESVTTLPGIGPARAQKLEKLGLRTLYDLVRYYPRRYEDRRRICTIREAPAGENVCISAVIASQPRTAHIRRGLDLTKVKAVDEDGVLELTFFNQSYLTKSLNVGESYLFYGTAEGTGNRRSMTSPTVEAEGKGQNTGRIVPIYPLTEGITNTVLSGAVRQAVRLCADGIPEPLPPEVVRQYDLMPPGKAARILHDPESFEELEEAKRRIAFEELFLLSIGLCRLKGRRDRAEGAVFGEGSLEEFCPGLPFAFTGAQKRTAEEILSDLRRGVPMNRLVQGDVGSGKTAVAAFAVYLAARSGYQSALMAPTELLAEQHYRTLTAMLNPYGIKVGLLTGSMKAAQKRDINERLLLGMVDLLIGTHALISDNVAYKKLGLVITDEQHRFGVNQRAALTAKGQNPHVLVMSATPIPRTLALMIYGDLDVSVIDELPPGRQPVETFRVHTDKRKRMYGFIRKQVEEGHQAYVVCPAVEDDPELAELDPSAPELCSATEYAKTLQNEELPDLRIGLVHGRLAPAAKDKVMTAFAEGDLDVLVSTTVVEVGVDVPNANLMVIENAERFGLSQLHQLRGRVGRGEAKSWCILVSDTKSESSAERLRALCATNDGFRIAEEDLKQRGPGDFFGARQHGLPQLHVADLAVDTRELKEAQEAARAVLAQDPDLTELHHREIRSRVGALFTENPDIFN